MRLLFLCRAEPRFGFTPATTPMHAVMFTLGVISVLVGLVRLFDKDADKKATSFVLALGAALLILGSDFGQRLRTLEVGETSLKATFSDQQATLTPQQVEGAQKAQELRFSSQPAANASSSPFGNPKDAIARTAHLYMERSANLHQALAQQGYTPVPDPSMDLDPGTVVSVAQNGAVTLLFRREDAFPQLQVQSSAFDFVQFTSLGGTTTGSNFIGLLDICGRGFRENMSDLSYAFTPITPAADRAFKQDFSLRVVRSVIGCYGKSFGDQPSQPQKRFVLGLTLTTVRH